jgi:hypothetical protein
MSFSSIDLFTGQKTAKNNPMQSRVDPWLAARCVLPPASGNALWVSAVTGNVGYWRESGRHVLYLSFSAFDPTETLAASSGDVAVP